MESAVKQTTSIQNKIIKELNDAPDAPKRFWSQFEDDIIKKYYGKKTTSAIAKAIGRSEESIKHRASDLRIKYQR